MQMVLILIERNSVGLFSTKLTNNGPNTEAINAIEKV